MQKETSLKKRYSIKLLASIISGVMGAVVIAIVPKALGPVMYGQFVYLQQFFMQVIGFLDAGSSIAFFTKLSAKQERKELLKFYFLYASFLLILLISFFYIIKSLDYTACFLPDINGKYLFLAIGFAYLTWGTRFFIKISDAYALTVTVELIKIIHKVFSVLLLLYFIKYLSFDLTLYFYYHYIVLSLFILIISYYFYKREVFSVALLTIKLDYKKLIKEFISYCSPLLMYSIVGLTVGLFDIWLLQKVSGSIETGYYGLAYSIAAMCFIFTGAMTPIITREFSKSYEENDIAKMQKLFKKYIPMLYSTAAYFGVFISIQSENVLAIFTSTKFEDAYWVLVVMALYPLHQTYGQLSGSIFYATGQTKLYRNIGVFSMGLGVCITLALIYIFNLGALGLALKMLIIQLVGVNIQLFFNMRFLELKIKPFLLHQGYSIVFFTLLAYMSSTLFQNIGSNLISFLLSGFLYTITVIILVYFVPSIFAISKNEYLYGLKKVMNVFKK